MTMAKFMMWHDFGKPLQADENLPLITEEDLQHQCQENYHKGYQEGMAVEKESTHQKIALFLSDFHLSLKELIETEETHRQEVYSQAINLAKIIGLQLALTEAEKHKIPRIEAALKILLNHLLTPLKIKVYLHPSLISPFEEILKTKEEGKLLQEGKLLLEGDITIEPGSCRFEWEDGSAHYLLSEATAKINQIIEEALKEGE